MTVDELLDEGLKAQEQGEVATALSFFQKALYSEKSADIYALVADAQIEAGSFAKAHKSLTAGLKLEPDNIDLLFTLADLYLEEGDGQKAADVYLKIIALDPEDGDAWGSLAVAQVNNNDLDAAEKSCRRALKIDPMSPFAHTALGDILLAQNRNDEALVCLQKAVELDPKNKLINFNLATAYYQMKKYDQAKKYYEKTLELDPNYVDAYKGLAYIILVPEEKITNEMNKDEVLMNDKLYNKYNQQRLDLYKKVLPVLEKALSVAPDDETVLVMLKKVYGDLEMKDKKMKVKAKLDALKGK